jgi:CRP/FNR family transcriptional regulator, cyclic AMP receptor protein
MKAQWYLTRQDFFAGLSAEKALFASRAEKRAIRRNGILFRQGEPADSAFYLEGGKVRICSVTAQGTESMIFVRNPGDIFGLAEVFGGVRRTCNAEAMTSCCLYEIKRAALEELLSQSWPLSRRVMETLGGRLRFLGEQVENFMSCDVTTRLEKLLYYLSCQGQAANCDGDGPLVLPVQLTQEHIAAMIGSCQQTVSEILKQLETDGLIRISSNRREITILQPARLAKSAS